ncbi:hypothetical protein [Streptomyces sp. 35G-GA-8]|uniref:hypothetical protein n=1 Tax=Streptomyces sp. 35G-GA-8 TaxID=2939434 RepID=UPI00201EABD0|nr:hypothetical protein [Streptomyces sp. 35G-GA-8]MCL7377627.1 hypothetical protein [Streptomyces sp. 35G-GA-8]
MPPSRLAPGTGIVNVPGEGLALRTADGEFLRIDTGRADGEALTHRLVTGAGGKGTETNDELAPLVEAFEEAGYAVPATADPRPGPLRGHTVLLLGDTSLTAPLARFAAAEGADLRTAEPAQVSELVEGHAPDVPTAVVWCLDSPVPEGLWDEADRLPAVRVGWLRCHREGAHTWIEPIASAPGDITSAHIRLRRLAATPAHRELAAYWAGHRTPDTGPRPTEASAALIASLLTADLVAWAAGERYRSAALPVRRRLRRVDLRDLTVTDHPVLPVPAVAPLPASAKPVGSRP